MNRKIFVVLSFLFSMLWCVSAAYSATVYVNTVTGRDMAGYGLTAARPYKTINYALGKSTGDTTVRIAAGTYNESINLNSIRIIQFKGAGKDNTILKGIGTMPVVSISGPNKTVITDLTVQGGNFGIFCKFASLYCRNIKIRDNNASGVLALGNSRLDILDSTAESNMGKGFQIEGGSSAQITRCAASKNTLAGIQVIYNSFAMVEESLVFENKASGIQVADGSALHLKKSEVHTNTYSGLDVTDRSVAQLLGGNKIHHNADSSGWRAGIGIHHLSQVSLSPGGGTVKDEIYLNDGPGIFTANSSCLFLGGGAVYENQGDGVHLRFDSTAQLESGADITSNVGYGLNCGDQGGDSKYWGTPGSVSGNTVGQINCGSF